MFEFKLPDLGEGVHEGQVVNVLVKEGDSIDEYQPMLEVETDKAAVEIPAPKAGTVGKIHVEAGQTVKVGEVLLTIDEGGGGGGGGKAEAKEDKADKKKAEEQEEKAEKKQAKSESEQAEESGETKQKESGKQAQRGGESKRREAGGGTTTAAPAQRSGNGPVPAAPVVRKLARELDVDINAVPGTGPGGRVLREDVERFAEGGAPAAKQGGGEGMSIPAVDSELPDFSQYGPVRREAVPQIRKTIAKQMMRAWLNVPRVTQTDEVDLTDLDRFRKDYNGKLGEGDAKLTMTAIIIKAAAAVLQKYPVINASYDAQTEEIVYKDFINFGIAVDTPRGLVVPVLRDADQKSLGAVAAELTEIGKSARDAKFEIKDLRGATFSITNYGAVGGTYGTPMVNFPEVAILGLGRAKWQPAVVDGEIKPRFIMGLSLSFDHRIVDGADAARFMNDLIAALENPLRMLSFESGQAS